MNGLIAQETNQSPSRAIGFDWYLGNARMATNAAVERELALYSRKFKVDTNELVVNLRKEVSRDQSVTGWDQVQPALIEVFGKAGMNFQTNPLKAITWNPGEASVEVRSTLDDLIAIDKILARLSPPSPPPRATNVSGVSKRPGPGRQITVKKLQNIRLATVFYDHTPLMEIVRDLHERSLELDPEKKGIRFAAKPKPAGIENQSKTGLPIARTNTSGGDVNIRDIAVTINPPLTNVAVSSTLLDAICNEPARNYVRS